MSIANVRPASDEAGPRIFVLGVGRLTISSGRGSELVQAAVPQSSAYSPLSLRTFQTSKYIPLHIQQTNKLQNPTMSYSALPDEIVLQIVNLVPSSDIDNFAQVDTRTRRVSLDRLQQRQALRKNSRVMSSRFGKTISPSHSIRRGHDSKDLGQPYFPNSLTHFDYLELNGDLHWLQPPSPEDTLLAAAWPQGNGVSKERLDELVAQGQRVGVSFPPAFLTLMGSTELMSRFFLGGDYFDLGPSLVKCNPDDDKSSGGYVINFRSDQQCCNYWALYVAPGYHCVLYAPYGVHCWKCVDVGPYAGIKWKDHPKYDTFEGVPVACEKLELSLAHPNFEAWLAMQYFNGWCRTWRTKGRELSEWQREYVEHFEAME
ncbi:hypothetical protein BDZ45DRAFT_285019 [Acephala macrosclerotiorum]|nr:hypothetical protein BDZ45DRAFT_285019 [Acephala macrosclerotiorum]